MKKTVVVGVCGGIAVYKACDLVSRLKKADYDVVVVMTKSATEFVTPFTFMTLSQNHVITGMFEEPKAFDVEHVSIAKKASLFLIVPATANFIGKAAAGIADDFLTTTVMATKAPVLVAPAMNTGMWENPAVQRNVETLKKRGYHFVEPISGHLACGDEGKGKLADVSAIVEHAEILLCDKKDLAGKTVLVTAGATVEQIDPVRYLTNPSSGKMGFAVAKKAVQRGAKVILIAGKTQLKPPYGAELVMVSSALSMYDAVMAHAAQADIIVKSAAVGDYRASEVAPHKIKKGKGTLQLELVQNPDILKSLGEQKKTGQILIGFCMETENLEANALSKLEKKNLDMIVANNLFDENAGFAVDTNLVTLYRRDGVKLQYPLLTKEEVADEILNQVAVL